MSKRKKRQVSKGGRPDESLYLTTYGKLEEYLRAFADGHFNLLILVGERGLAKSRTVRAVLGTNVCWIEGNATAFGMYEKLYRHRDEFVVIDDVDSLYADKSGIRLLKGLCQTRLSGFHRTADSQWSRVSTTCGVGCWSPEGPKT